IRRRTRSAPMLVASTDPTPQRRCGYFGSAWGGRLGRIGAEKAQILEQEDMALSAAGRHDLFVTRFDCCLYRGSWAGMLSDHFNLDSRAIRHDNGLLWRDPGRV